MARKGDRVDIAYSHKKDDKKIVWQRLALKLFSLNNGSA